MRERQYFLGDIPLMEWRDTIPEFLLEGINHLTLWIGIIFVFNVLIAGLYFMINFLFYDEREEQINKVIFKEGIN